MSALCWANHLAIGCCRFPPSLAAPLLPPYLRPLYRVQRQYRPMTSSPLSSASAVSAAARWVTPGVSCDCHSLHPRSLFRRSGCFSRSLTLSASGLHSLPPLPPHVRGSGCCSRSLTVSASVRQREQAWDIPDRDVVVRVPDNEGNRVLDIMKRPCFPMMKNMFCARFVSEVLEFPEVLSKIQVEDLEAKLGSVGFSNGQWQEKPSLETLASSKLLSSEVPEEFGGLSYTMTENVRVMEAVALTDHAPAVISQNLIMQILQQHGSEHLRDRWLTQLSSGRVMATLCTAESAGTSDLAAMRSVARRESGRAPMAPLADDSPLATALKDIDGGQTGAQCDLRLNGEKVAVLAASNARLFLVTASIEQTSEDGDVEVEPSVFLVDREAGGVTVTACPHRPGLYTVRFENTPIFLSNMIGEAGEAYSIFTSAFSHSRVLAAAQTAAMLRPLVDAVMHHCIHRESFGRYTSDFCLPRYHFAHMASELYSLESMVYTTAGIHDLSEIPDYTLEAAACHVAACRVARNVLETAGRLLGTVGQTRSGDKGELLERCTNLAAIFSRYTASEEMTKMFITLEGLKFASSFHSADVKIWRDPVENPLDSVKRTFRRAVRRQGLYKYDVDSFLHPSFQPEAGYLENMMCAFSDSLSQSLVNIGNEMMNQQSALVWLCDSITAIYSSCCVLSRASRSYSIGLQDGQTEVNLARAHICDSHEMVECLSKNIVNSPLLSPDRYYLDAANRLVETTKSGSTHCLTRLF